MFSALYFHMFYDIDSTFNYCETTHNAGNINQNEPEQHLRGKIHWPWPCLHEEKGDRSSEQMLMKVQADPYILISFHQLEDGGREKV